MTSTKLDKLKMMDRIISRLEGDLNQLKLWIKTEIEAETEAQNNEFDAASFCSTSLGESSTDEDFNLVRQHPEESSIGGPDMEALNKILKSPDMIVTLMDQRLGNEKEFILGEDYHKEVAAVNNSSMKGDLEEKSKNSKRKKLKVIEHFCDFCGKGFSSSWNRNMHHDIHLEGLNFECEICHHKTKTRDRLKAHKYHKHGSSAKKGAKSQKPRKSKANSKPKVNDTFDSALNPLSKSIPKLIYFGQTPLPMESSPTNEMNSISHEY